MKCRALLFWATGFDYRVRKPKTNTGGDGHGYTATDPKAEDQAEEDRLQLYGRHPARFDGAQPASHIAMLSSSGRDRLGPRFEQGEVTMILIDAVSPELVSELVKEARQRRLTSAKRHETINAFLTLRDQAIAEKKHADEEFRLICAPICVDFDRTASRLVASTEPVFKAA